MIRKKTYSVKSRIVSALRKVWRYSPLKKEVYYRNLVAKRSREIDYTYKCEKCDFIGIKSEFNIDHVIPVVGLEGMTTWDDYILRLFCATDKTLKQFNSQNLMLLCTTCHDVKTQEESKIRKLNKKFIDKDPTNSVKLNKRK